MPITLAKIANNTASVTFAYGQDTVTVDYYPGHVTEKTFAQLEAFSSANETKMGAGFVSFNQVLAGLISSWDVYEDEEQTQMFPLEAGRLAELPIPFRKQVLEAIMGDIRPESFASQS